MATHSTDLAWRILGTEELGGLPSMESPRVGHDWSDLAAAGFRATIGVKLYTIFRARQSQSCHIESQVLIFRNNQSALSCVKQIASGNLLYTAGSSSVLCDDLDGGGREDQKGGDICIDIADSLNFTAETSNILKLLYPREKEGC